MIGNETGESDVCQPNSTFQCKGQSTYGHAGRIRPVDGEDIFPGSLNGVVQEEPGMIVLGHA
jgi:hypothetical protein